MELIFNLLWLTLSLALILWWVIGQRRGSRESRGYSRRMQIVALVILIVVLLPVVSLTDDLRTGATPAEAEHFARRVDLQINPDTHLHSLSVAIFAVVALEQASRLQTLSYLRPAAETKAPSAHHVRVSGNRPPPFA